MSMMLPPKPKASTSVPPAGKTAVASGAAPSFTSNDLLEPGIEINLGTYFLQGWCTPKGEPLGDHLALNAAGVARAWARLGLLVHAPLDAIVRLEALVASSFNEKTTKWTDNLPAELRSVLIERAPETDQPEAVAQWFAAVGPTLKTWADLRALVQHLMAVAQYMGIESQMRAASREENVSVSAQDEIDHMLVVEDPVRTILQGHR